MTTTMPSSRKATRPYSVTAKCGVGFETTKGGFFVKTLFVECAMARAHQEWASDRANQTRSAAIYENGKVVRIVDWRDFSNSQTL